MAVATLIAVRSLVLEDLNATGGLAYTGFASPYLSNKVSVGSYFFIDANNASILIRDGHAATSAAHASSQSLLWPKSSKDGPA